MNQLRIYFSGSLRPLLTKMKLFNKLVNFNQFEQKSNVALYGTLKFKDNTDFHCSGELFKFENNCLIPVQDNFPRKRIMYFKGNLNMSVFDN